MRAVAKNVLVVGLATLNILLLARLLVGGQSIFAYSHQKDRHDELVRKLEQAESRNIELSREIKRLKNDRKYQEKIVRERLNFVRKDEILYVFPEKHQTGGEASNASEN